jgi:hypothetical protein
VDGERVHAAGKLLRQRGVDHAMPLQSALSAERLGHNIETEVRFTAGTVAGMALVTVRLILDMQAFGREGLLQFFPDHVLGSHDLQALEHDPEKWKPVFRKDHARSINVNVHDARFCHLSSLEAVADAVA